MLRTGYFAASAAGEKPSLVRSIGFASTLSGPSGEFSTPSWSLSQIPHIEGQQRLAVFTYGSVRGDANSSIVTSATINGGSCTLLTQGSNNAAGAHSAIAWVILPTSATTASARFVNANSALRKSIEGWVIQGTNVQVVDQKQGNLASSGSGSITLPLVSPLDGGIALISGGYRGNLTFSNTSGWVWTQTNDGGSTGEMKHGWNPDCPAGTTNVTQGFSSTTSGRHMTGIMVHPNR